MSNGKHTASWSVAARNPEYVVIPGIVKPIDCGSAERARLIAAAPEMEAVLIFIRDNAEVFPDVMKMVNAALSKAGA